MTRKVRVRVDHDVCVGSATCTRTVPKVFALNAQRQSQVTDPGGDAWQRVVEAAESCPVSAITVEDAETGERLFP